MLKCTSLARRCQVRFCALQSGFAVKECSPDLPPNDTVCSIVKHKILQRPWTSTLRLSAVSSVPKHLLNVIQRNGDVTKCPVPSFLFFKVLQASNSKCMYFLKKFISLKLYIFVFSVLFLVKYVKKTITFCFIHIFTIFCIWVLNIFHEAVCTEDDWGHLFCHLVFIAFASFVMSQRLMREKKVPFASRSCDVMFVKFT